MKKVSPLPSQGQDSGNHSFSSVTSLPDIETFFPISSQNITGTYYVLGSGDVKMSQHPSISGLEYSKCSLCIVRSWIKGQYGVP
jgi:hypothetical protein